MSPRASPRPPRPPRSAAGAAGALLGGLGLACAIVGGLGTLGLMGLIVADVVGRGAFSAPVPATAEIVAASIVGIVFLQLPEATASGRMIRSDMMLGRLAARSARAAAALDAAHHAVGAVVMGIVLRYVGPEIAEAIRDRETVGLYGILVLPRWPFLVCVLAGAVLTFAQFVRLAILAAARARRAGRAA